MRAEPVITWEPERTLSKLKHHFTLNKYGYSLLPFADSHLPSSIYREKNIIVSLEESVYQGSLLIFLNPASEISLLALLSLQYIG